MYFIYHSMTGMVNLVYSSSYSSYLCKWEPGNRIPYSYGFRLLPFSQLQPLAVYLSAGKLASGSGEDTEIRLDDAGIQVKSGKYLR